ncbi:MAG: esterase-like activity of phytase family protein [Pseudomonadota bacterium]
MKTWCLGLLLGLWPTLAGSQAPVPGARDITIKASPVPLNSESPRTQTLGQLAYEGGLSLSSEDEDFGGLSGLIIAPDQSHLIAVTDRGHWVCMVPLHSPEGRLISIESAWMRRMKGLNGKGMTGKQQTDAEGLTRTPDGTAILASFEGEHRIWRYATDDPTDLCSVASAVPEPVALPQGVTRLPNNGGLEAITALPDASLVVLSEHGRAGGGRLGWRLPIEGLTDSPAQRLAYKVPKPFAPTDMTQFGEHVYVMHRHFSVLSGVSGLISRIPIDAFCDDTNVVSSEELARFSPPITVDNFEGISAVAAPLGRTGLYVVSDDNFNPFQQTLLLKFSLTEN